MSLLKRKHEEEEEEEEKTEKKVCIQEEETEYNEEECVKKWTGCKTWVNMGKMYTLVIYKDGRCQVMDEDGFVHRIDPSECRDLVSDVWWGDISWSHKDDQYHLRRNQDGSEKWLKNGYIHRDGDLHSEIDRHDTKIWRQTGCIHRDHDRPALVRRDGGQEWYQWDLHHRENNLPAYIGKDRNNLQKQWKIHDILHNLRGAAIMTKISNNPWEREYYIEGAPVTQRHIDVIRMCATKWIHRLKQAYLNELLSSFSPLSFPVDIIQHTIIHYIL